MRMEDGVALQEDLLIEILAKLAVKSLVRFRCVSRHWCSLIQSPNFVNMHIDCNGNEIVLLKRKLPLPDENGGSGEGEVLSFHDPDSLDLLVSPNLSIPPFLDDSRFYDICYYDYMGTSNGLICLSLADKVILCNPALREFELLPRSPFVCPGGHFALQLTTAFGYDAIADAYKVVQLCEVADEKEYLDDPDENWMRIDLYDSRTNCWRPIEAVIPLIINDCENNLFFNGAFHWLCKELLGKIISFAISTEVFQEFDYPIFEDYKSPSLVVLNQCLSVVRHECCMGVFETVDIWVMKEYGVNESWTKEFVIGPCAFSYALLLLKNEWLVVQSMEDQLASCALHANEFKRFNFYGTTQSMQAVMFKESLVSLKQVMHGKTQ